MLHAQKAVRAALCLVGCLHLASFTAMLTQSWYLYGEGGLQPVSAFLQLAAEQVLHEGSTYPNNLWTVFRSHPTLLWLHSSLGISAATFLMVLCIAGVLVSVAAACGVLQPSLFGMLWILHLSVSNVGQAFTPQPGDAILLELTFACIWLAVSRSRQRQTASSLDAQIEEVQDTPVAGASKQEDAEAEPALLLLRWLLFKLLLLSSSSKATVVCSNVSNLASCYRAMLAHGQPHLLTWWLQAVPDALGAIVTALSLLQGVCAFMLLCTSASVQKLTTRIVLSLQLIKLVCGSMTLADAAGAVLCIFLMEETAVVTAWQRIRGLFTGRRAELPAEGAVGPAGAELLGYKAGARHKRNLSADSLASLLTEYDQQLPSDSTNSWHLWNPLTARTDRLTIGVIVVVAALLYGVDSNSQLVLRWTLKQITAVLQFLVPAAVVVWFVYLLQSIRKSYTIAAQAAAVAAAAAETREADLTDTAQKRNNKIALEAFTTLLAEPVAENTEPETTGMADKDVKPAVVSLAPIATTAADAEAVKPARRGRAAASKAGSDAGTPKGTPRKGSRSKAAAAGDDSDATTERAERPAAAETPNVARGRVGAAARGRNTAAAVAEAGPKDKGVSDASAAQGSASLADTPAAAGSETPAVPSAATTVRKQAMSATPATAAGAAVQVNRSAASGYARLRKLLASRLPVFKAVMVAAVVMAVFLMGLPAVLLPAGYTQSHLGSVPGLLSSYHTARSYGIVSSDAVLRSDLQPTAIAAEQQPGSYLVYEFETSFDGDHWQPVQWKGGLSSVAAGHSSAPGLYNSRLQGKLVAAGEANLADDMWLLSVVDKLHKGAPVLSAVLAQPVQPHDWVRINLVRYTPSCLNNDSKMNGTSSSTGKWVVQHVAEVLPATQQGDQDLQEALSELGWVVPKVKSAPPGLLASIPTQAAVSVLLLAVAFWHCFAPYGLACA